MKLARVILRTTDLGRSLVFWSQTVGLELVGQSEAFAFLDGGGVQLVINQVDEAGIDETLTELVFEVDDIRAAYSLLEERGVAFEVEPRTVMESEGRALQATHFHDPDGHLASITGWTDID